MATVLFPSSKIMLPPPPPTDHSYQNEANGEEQTYHHEKQISVDPISLKELTRSPPLVPPPPPFLKPTKFLSASLPGSTTSSPRRSSPKSKKKWKHQAQLVIDPLSRQHSAVLSRLAHLQQLNQIRRSKSCGEGRATAPCDDLDLWLFKNSNNIISLNDTSSNKKTTKKKMNMISSFGKTEHKKPPESGGDDIESSYDEKFKCGALCLFLPGFGTKLVKPKARDETEPPAHVISKRISLEKFECGSWTSSAIIMEADGVGDSGSNLFFDLPLELIREGVNDADSPVKAAFVFDDDKADRKGVLKTSTARKATSSTRHVHFSVSSPTSSSSLSPATSNPTSPASCITPRLRKAREEFNAFLEAQQSSI
ncbi:uncharacterized protein LOC127807891 [Diospyros lotus]|uniref:uncharacterized protein LOC127807891 n=1 Tax=Diospyros lotus TaxID=55363 RepID=UPI0022505B1D|nr:uncharacterized protein LOC127807891 [Diospyros lotus]